MTDTLTPKRLAEIDAKRLNVYSNGVLHEANDCWALLETDIPDLLASHAALQAEVERLTRAADDARFQFKVADAENGELVRAQVRLAMKAREDAATAREAGAREMRDRCAEELRGELLFAQSCLASSERINNAEYVNGWNVRIMALNEAINAISALPLTPADGAKDE